MKKISLLISILGIFILFMLNIYPLEIKKVNSPYQINNLSHNEVFYFNGKVIKEYRSNNLRTIILDNQIKFSCKCESHLNKKIRVYGKINSYESRNYLIIRKIEEIK